MKHRFVVQKVFSFTDFFTYTFSFFVMPQFHQTKSFQRNHEDIIFISQILIALLQSLFIRSVVHQIWDCSHLGLYSLCHSMEKKFFLLTHKNRIRFINKSRLNNWFNCFCGDLFVSTFIINQRKRISFLQIKKKSPSIRLYWIESWARRKKKPMLKR